MCTVFQSVQEGLQVASQVLTLILEVSTVELVDLISASGEGAVEVYVFKDKTCVQKANVFLENELFHIGRDKGPLQRFFHNVIANLHVRVRIDPFVKPRLH